MITPTTHISWNLDGMNDYSTFAYNYAPLFYFSYNGINTANNAKSYAIAIQNRLIKLINSGYTKLAIFISGKDSEIIAIECKKLGIDFELFFLNIGDLNWQMLNTARIVSVKLNVTLNVITIPKFDIMPFAEESYIISRVNKPTYLVLPYMFSQIPADRYIIIGEGDLNKGGNSYMNFTKINSNAGIPILNTEIAYLIHARKMNVHGDFYFHSSSPELIKTIWDHPLLVRDFPLFDTRNIIKDEWGASLCFTEKTTNWDTVDGTMYNQMIRKHIFQKYAPSYNVLTCTVGCDIL